ncbi:MAG: class 3 adenylate cyclase/tetratricopeptide (TPR) repeat protein [Flavobacteriaceae bacterium]|jgi:class 3 adenylate cyclase/tetratricopeptide (TPR) repeat protein
MNAQTKLDSLYTVWENKTQADSIRASAYVDYIWDGFLFNKPDSAFILAKDLIAFAQDKKLPKSKAGAYRLQAVSFYVQGNYPQALDYFQSALKISEEIDDEKGIAGSVNNIGLIYNAQGNFSQALDYFQRSLKIQEEIGNRNNIALALNNIGAIYYHQSNSQKSLDYYHRSLKISEEIEDNLGIANLLNNIGAIYLEQNKLIKALDYFQRSLKIREEIGDEIGIAGSLNNIGELYNVQGVYNKAITPCQRSLNLSKELSSIEIQKSACDCLYGAYKGLGEGNKALEYHEQFTVLNDSIFNEANTKKLTQLEMQYDFDKKEAATQMEQEKKDVIAAQELKRKKVERNGFMAGFAVVLLFAGVFFRQRNRIGKEKDRSEELLMNILPKEVAEELKEKGHSDAQLINHVTVLFTDFKGFTALSEQLSPKELVEDLHTCFSEFDRICEKYGIEKIKTIGDSYMAAGGLPSPNTTHAQDVVKATIEMAEVIERAKIEKTAANQPFFEVRIGVHTGPVVAGIVGVKKFQYDIWGDTVNTASRMESSGDVGKVNISEATYKLLKDDADFTFESRGKIEAKGKGEIEMYFVSMKKE